MNSEEIRSLYYALLDMGELESQTEIVGEWEKDKKVFVRLLKERKISY